VDRVVDRAATASGKMGAQRDWGWVESVAWSRDVGQGVTWGQALPVSPHVVHQSSACLWQLLLH
jgi:hypothetical protein